MGLYKAKLKNYPLTWHIRARSEEQATAKAWKAIERDLDPESVKSGGYIILEAVEGYRELKGRQQEEINAFPFVWAFSEKQFFENVRSKWGIDPEKDRAQIASIGGGGYIRKADGAALEAMTKRHRAELEAAIAADQTGDGFIFDMFNLELGNHEYIITGDIGPTLRALGFTVEEINESKALLTGLQKAVDNQSEEYSY